MCPCSSGWHPTLKHTWVALIGYGGLERVGEGEWEEQKKRGERKREKEEEEGEGRGGGMEEELWCYVGWRHTGGVGGAMRGKKKNEINNPSLLFCLFLGVLTSISKTLNGRCIFSTDGQSCPVLFSSMELYSTNKNLGSSLNVPDPFCASSYIYLVPESVAFYPLPASESTPVYRATCNGPLEAHELPPTWPTCSHRLGSDSRR